MKAYQFGPLIIVAALIGCSKKADVAPEITSVTAPTPVVVAPAAATPVASVALAAPSAADLAKGEKIYTATCLACHGAGVLGAPKFGDKAAWQPRIAKGIEVLYTDSINGFKLMPARGGNAALKDDEMKAAVDYMTSKAM